MKKAIVTVIGRDRVGIIHLVSALLSECNVNILDISQTVLQEFFTMVMLVDVSGSTLSFGELRIRLEEAGKPLELSICIQHEDIFNAMHTV